MTQTIKFEDNKATNKTTISFRIISLAFIIMLATAEKKHVAGFDSNAVNDEDNESEQENNEDELEVLDEPDDILLSSNVWK